MRFPFLAAFIFVISYSFAAVGQETQKPRVKIICPRIHPKLVMQVRPKYPKEAKQSGIEGKVSLRCIIGTDGSVREIEVISGEEPFAQAAKAAVAQWKYEPIKLNGVAVQADTTVDVIFELPKRPASKHPKALF